jgi:multiple sugar transport system permease protein
LPLLRPTLFFVLVTQIISMFQAFDTIYSLTKGGPMNGTDVIAYRIYDQAFTDFNLGKAAVTAVVLFVILVVITLGQHLYFRRRITYDLS